MTARRRALALTVSTLLAITVASAPGVAEAAPYTPVISDAANAGTIASTTTAPEFTAVAATIATTATTTAPEFATRSATPSGCTAITQRGVAPSVRRAAEDGPHSPASRVRASLGVACPKGATVLDVDLGDITLPRAPGSKGVFRSPVRGVLALPRDKANAPLVIVSHLRAANCADGSLAYPCPGGKQRRLDRGMTYLGERLARQGYAVLIPDVAPVWVGQHMAPPVGDYDQEAAWLQVVSTLRDRVAQANKRSDRILGDRVVGRIDMSKAGLVVHSRSGYVAGPAVRAWQQGPTPIASVLAYGPAYDSAPGERLTPSMPDVPYLAVEGTKDSDVPFKASRWLDAHILAPRTAPALVAGVPGFGHNYVNRALSAAGVDDRTSCETGCVSAARHEDLLARASLTWFDATLRGRPTRDLPMSAGNRLPARFAGVPVTWLASTNASRSVVFDSSAPATAHPVGGAKLTLCRFYEPMDPTPHADACPAPARGVVETAGQVALVTLTRTAGVRLDAGGARARVLVVHATPHGDRSDGAAHSPLRATLRLVDGRTVVIDMPRSAALRNRATVREDGTYPVATVRAALPPALQGT